MDKKIECQNKNRQQPVRVRVIKAPLVNTHELRQIIMSRARALVL
jgi:hypothetical protein